MDYSIKKRIMNEAIIYLKYKTTVRGVSLLTGVSKSTIHNDFTKRLIDIDLNMYKEVMKQLQYNKDVRHIRGGQATKEIYMKKSR